MGTNGTSAEHQREIDKLTAYKLVLAGAIPDGGHVSPETALTCPDYPYGWELRCTMRYWIEYKPGKGWRMMSQTTNPKKAGHPWNKPKASTYTLGVVLLAIDETTGHVCRIDLDAMQASEPQAWAFLAWAGEQLSAAQRHRVFQIIARAQAEGEPEANGTLLQRYRARLALLLAGDAIANGHEAVGGTYHATV